LIQQSGVSFRFHSHYFSAPSEHFLQKNFLKISLQFPAGDMVPFQGGAIYANQGTMEIYDSTIESNAATNVSTPYLQSRSEKFPDFCAPLPGGGHATSRAVLFMPKVVPMWRSTAPYSSRIALLQL
jgi:hypothetical protein